MKREDVGRGVGVFKKSWVRLGKCVGVKGKYVGKFGERCGKVCWSVGEMWRSVKKCVGVWEVWNVEKVRGETCKERRGEMYGDDCEECG